MNRYWTVPVSFITGFLFSVLWDLADGPDDIPPWFDRGAWGYEPCD